MQEIVSYLKKCGVQYLSTTGIEGRPLVKTIYADPENPHVEVFHLAEANASISEIGKPPVAYKF
ncbi:MAG: hypothetical protein DRI83_03945 [Bacteroidetes bacterium]|nr:MAG: hypothetical protein DRI83_03945 [Bacteroidota bacterium]